MGYKLSNEINSADLANELALEFAGQNIKIEEFSSLSSAKTGSLTFAKLNIGTPFAMGVTIICQAGITVPPGCCCIYSENPRLTFANVLSKYSKQNRRAEISATANISPASIIGKNVIIGYGTIVSANVIIGDNCEIGNNVTIAENVKIGNNTRIKSNSVVGEKGFGFEYDNDLPVEFPQIGGVVIGSYVEIGALCTVASGTLDPTIIKDYVKIDDHVHVAHNVSIGEASIITACVEFSGGITTGKKVWIGPQAALMNKINIGDNSLIGLGSVVRKDVKPNSIVAGNPAKFLREIE